MKKYKMMAALAAAGYLILAGNARMGSTPCMAQEELFTYTADGIVTITRYLGDEETVTIPQEIDGGQVRSIGTGAFSGNETVRNVICPEGLVFIGASSFSGSAVESVTLSSTVVSIADMAFSSCTQLKEMHIPSGVQQIGAYAFADAGLELLVLPAGVDIDATALKNVPLECVRVSDDATDDQIKALDDRLWFPWYAPLVREHDESSFVFMEETASDETQFETDEEGNLSAYLGTQEEVVIPRMIGQKRVGGILPGAFARSGITKVTIPDTVHQLGAGAFQECAQLQEVHCYGPLETTGRETFRDCSSLTTVQFYNGVRKIDAWAFAGAGRLWKVQFDEELNEIGEGAFMGSALRHIRADARRIGKQAFAQCPDLASIVIGSRSEEILDEAFAGCPKLKRIYLEKADASIFVGTGHFTGCPEDMKVVYMGS